MSSINEEGLQAREGLLLWCQRKTAGSPYHPDVDIRDFKRSWSTGLAFERKGESDCAVQGYTDQAERESFEAVGTNAGSFSRGEHVYSTEDFLRIYDDIARKDGAVTYEAFVELLVTITEDSSSPEQLIEAFRLLAQGDDVVTGEDLRRARISPTATSFLSEAMPSLVRPASDGENGEDEPVYDYRAFLKATFAQP
ncbi:hypothetical protein QFC19_009114 [Naganishia cerealis]|uniref:Uncharacterized protein n=1 Tax=Naganishia cerealis TaxID=610337 RepID=A0ACC2UWE4_9TREE|nr:hypothetical protein QFC19_009114 [Naganishia cerealis]